MLFPALARTDRTEIDSGVFQLDVPDLEIPVGGSVVPADGESGVRAVHVRTHSNGVGFGHAHPIQLQRKHTRLTADKTNVYLSYT